MPKAKAREERPPAPDYKALASLRHQLRRFLTFSKAAAESAGLAPQQYQALLSVKACGDEGLSITALSEQLIIRRHTAVELSVRLEKAGLVRRVKPPKDRRRVLLYTTEQAEDVLRRLAVVHHEQLGQQSRDLIEVLSRLSPLTSKQPLCE